MATTVVSQRKQASPGTPPALEDPLINRGVAFSLEEREQLGLTGRLPSGVLGLEEQARRAYSQLQSQPTDLAKNVYLEQVHDRNVAVHHERVDREAAEVSDRCGGAHDVDVGRGAIRGDHDSSPAVIEVDAAGPERLSSVRCWQPVARTSLSLHRTSRNVGVRCAAW
jgi:hypothetical protein